MSAYALQSGEAEKIKEEFLKDWEDVMSRGPRTENIVMGADLNGHFLKSAWRKRIWPKEQRRGEHLGKHGEPRLGTIEHFLQQKRRAANHL